MQLTFNEQTVHAIIGAHSLTILSLHQYVSVLSVLIIIIIHNNKFIVEQLLLIFLILGCLSVLLGPLTQLGESLPSSGAGLSLLEAVD